MLLCSSHFTFTTPLSNVQCWHMETDLYLFISWHRLKCGWGGSSWRRDTRRHVSRVTRHVTRLTEHRTLSILSPECHIDIGTIVRKLTDKYLNIYHSQLISSSNIYAFKIQTLLIVIRSIVMYVFIWPINIVDWNCWCWGLIKNSNKLMDRSCWISVYFKFLKGFCLPRKM